MKLRVLLVDDERLAIDRLSELLGDIDGVEIVGSASTAAAAQKIIEQYNPDCIFLDIQLPGKSGLALAASLSLEGRAEIVFVTAFEHFAPDAFEVEAADYLLKPVRLDRLRQAVVRVQRRRAMISAPGGQVVSIEAHEFVDEFWVPVRGGKARVTIDMIEWIEAAKDYVILHTPTRSFLHRISMNELERKLDPRKLFRVHRSAFITPGLVSELIRPSKGMVSLKLRDGAVVPVGPSYAKEVVSRLTGVTAFEGEER